ncbi:hypothetical protein [Streptomyces sp. MUM 178J]|uniref:hypothetical protein n=1 Tax=Streptomyces sp. MUM 178J TaxID=2791991 RepID=UPI001F036676|nr:hypothetical protein [Streptomyces sp. MUM 178J]WRQ82886.1 hypothetical protein I3F59_028025 [Streptomyces sp. MUM 178J]
MRYEPWRQTGLGPVVAKWWHVSGLAQRVFISADPILEADKAQTMEGADLHGTWEGWAGSLLTLRQGGTAEVLNLDGQEFRFDDEWRMTGSGSWSLSEPGRYKGGNTVGSGYVVHVDVSRRSAEDTAVGAQAPSPSPLPTEAAARTSPPPEKASWDLGVTKNKAGELTLFFLTSDPDVRDAYYLSKKM